MSVSVHRFTNGLRHVHWYVEHAKVAHIGLIVKAGTRDEDIQGSGTAHALEHMLFKGTVHRKPFHILNRIDSVGGELNAYTNKEDTCLYASIPWHETRRAVELLSDMFYRSTLQGKEWVKEKAVILDELFAYEDDIQENMTELFEELIFGEHVIGHRIIGYEEELKKLGIQGIRDFYAKYFTNDNTVVFSVGPQKPTAMKKLIEQFFSEETPSASPRVLKAPSYTPRQQQKQLPIVQSHTTLGGIAPDLHRDERTAMGLLINVLGGPSLNNKLSLNIREKYGFAYFLESNYILYSDAGLFEVYFNTEPKQQERCEALVRAEMAKFCKKPMTETALQAAKKQLKGQVVMGYDNAGAVGQYLARQLLNFGEVRTYEKDMMLIDQITTNDVYELANRYFNPSELSRMVYEPK